MRKIESGPLVNGVSMADDITSSVDGNHLLAVLDTGVSSGYSMQYWSEGDHSHIGTLYIEKSNDGVHWVTETTVSVTDSALISGMYEKTSVVALYNRIRYDFTDGTGTLHVIAASHHWPSM